MSSTLKTYRREWVSHLIQSEEKVKGPEENWRTERLASVPEAADQVGEGCPACYSAHDLGWGGPLRRPLVEEQRWIPAARREDGTECQE